MSDSGKRYAEAVAGEVRASMARQRILGTDLAEVLDISQNSVSRRVTGKQPFGVDELADVADALGVPITSLLPAQWAPRGSNPQPADYAPQRPRPRRLRIVGGLPDASHAAIPDARPAAASAA